MTERTMPEEGGFLRRWARRKAEAAAGTAPAPEPVRAEAAPAAGATAVAAPAPAAPAAGPAERVDPAAAPLPTMADVAQLTRDSDFSAFVARGVDADVRRSALKKLFSDPHFNAIDRLDVYMDDYTKPSPVSPAMLAGLKHAKSVFWRPDEEEAESTAGQAGADAAAPAPAVAPAVLAPAGGMAAEDAAADGPCAGDTAASDAAADAAAAAAVPAPAIVLPPIAAPDPSAPNRHAPDQAVAHGRDAASPFAPAPDTRAAALPAARAQ